MKKNATDRPVARRNAIFLTLRMTIAVIVGLYTSRIVLAALGIDDFGLLGAVTATIGIFSFVNSSLTESSTRFIACAAGRDAATRRRTFSTALTLHLAAAALLMAVAATAGLWFVRNGLSLPPDKTGTAATVMTITAASAAVAIVRGAWAAAVTARERMSFYAVAEIANVILRLMSALYVSTAQGCRVEIYAALSLGCELSVTLGYAVFCRRRFDDCRRPRLSVGGAREMLSFSGWELSARLAGSFSTHATDVALNVFFGLGYSAAAAVCRKVTQAASGLAGAPAMAFKPVVFKQYARGDTGAMAATMAEACRLCIPGACMIAVPCLLTGPMLLRLWLGDVPPHTAGLLNVIVIGVMLEPLSRISSCAIMATGRMKRVSLVNSALTAAAFAVALVIMKNGIDPVYAYIAAIPAAMLCIASNLVAAKAVIDGFSLRPVVVSAAGTYLLCLPGTVAAIPVMTLCAGLHDAVTIAAVTVTYVSVTAICLLLSKRRYKPLFITPAT